MALIPRHLAAKVARTRTLKTCQLPDAVTADPGSAYQRGASVQHRLARRLISSIWRRARVQESIS